MRALWHKLPGGNSTSKEHAVRKIDSFGKITALALRHRIKNQLLALGVMKELVKQVKKRPTVFHSTWHITRTIQIKII